MELAYKLNADGKSFVTIDGTDRPREFDATFFDKEFPPEKGRFVCACCNEPVKWMPHGLNEGGFKPRKSHWAAINRDAHIAKGCTAISTEEFDESLSVKCTENQAIANPNITILIRLNFQTRKGLFARNRKEMTYERLWCRKHRGFYKPKVIHTMDQLAKFMNKLVADAPEGANVAERVMISHGGQTRALNQVLLTEQSQRTDLYKRLHRLPWQHREGGQFITGGFPCIVPFGLGYGERKNIGNLSRVFNAAASTDYMQEMFRTPQAFDSADLLLTSGYVIAWPYLNKKNPGKLMWSIHDMGHITGQKINLHPNPPRRHFRPAAE